MKHTKRQIELEKRRELWLKEQETLNRGRFSAEEALRLARGSNKPLRIDGCWVYPTDLRETRGEASLSRRNG